VNLCKLEFQAIDWLRAKLKRNDIEVVFILLGDDKTWAENLFPNNSNIFIPPMPAEKTVDLALMATSCDVILLTSSWSTFGFWGAYLSDRATVYYNEEYAKVKNGYFFNQFTPSDVFPSKWTALKFDSTSNMTL
jgi:hypothetical protein